MNKVTHLTSVHQRHDIRIFVKMCSSLAKNGDYSVSLIVADGKGHEVKNGVSIVDIGAKNGGRISRMTKTVKRIFEKAKEIDSDIYHLHDPELIPVGLKLKKLGKKVIFDAHEDFPKQLLQKTYLSRFNRKMLSIVFEYFEKYACKKFDYIVTATPAICKKFSSINYHSIDINNYPIIGELSSSVSWNERKNEVCYIGGTTISRGLIQLLETIGLTPKIKLNIAGPFSPKSLENEAKSYPSWKNIEYFGTVNRDGVSKIMSESKAGLVTFLPAPNHIDAQPNKMFEYMSAALPVIASNFPLWGDIIEGSNCGICVDPLNPNEIANAIKYIIENPKESEQMGQNGKKAVMEKYNWSIEEQKLYKIYEDIMND